MTRTAKTFQRSIIVLVKLLLIFSMLAVFYGVYLTENANLRVEMSRISRVSTIVITTFLVVFYAMLRIYGGYAIGQRRTKEIALSTAVAVVVTDCFAYIQLCVMDKRIVSLGHLVVIIALQCVIIIVLTKFSNKIYYNLNPPRDLLIIHGNEEKLAYMQRKLLQYKNRFNVNRTMRYDEPELHRSIRSSEAVMLIDIPTETRDYIMEYCYKRSKQFYYLPALPDILMNNAEHELIDDTSLFSYEHTGLNIEQRIFKRACDLVLSILGIALTWPIMLIEAIAIRLSDGGPALFKQERVTEAGKSFKLLKFRTMIMDAEKGDTAVLAERNDPRITKIGAFLRKTRLDELPQLFNILFGSMSIVGPRPERPAIAEEYYKDLPEFRYRLKVKAGLTGLAQIMGKYNTTPRDKLILDLIYIENYSLRLDLKLMFQTITVFLFPEKTTGFKNTAKTVFTEDNDKSE